MLKNKSPATAIAGRESANQVSSPCKRNTRPPKIHRVLQALASGRSFNIFEAERELHDHRLPATVLDVERRYGIRVFREFETVAGFQGAPTRVCRYRLVGPELMKARQWLANAQSDLGAFSSGEAGNELRRPSDGAS